MKKGVSEKMRQINETIQPICRLLFIEEYNEIIGAEKNELEMNIPILECMGGENYNMGEQIFIKRDYVNSLHVDFKDYSPTIALWVEELPGQSKDWDFVFPNNRMNDCDGLVINLRNGIMIGWHGKKLRHLTTLGNLKSQNHVYGIAWCKNQ